MRDSPSFGCSPRPGSLAPVELRARSPEEIVALAAAGGRDLRRERTRALAVLILAAGCALAALFVALTS